MEYGHIVLANSKKGLIPNLIKLITRSRYSHSLITMPSILGMQMCAEAADSGVSMLRFDTGYTNNPDQDIVSYNVNVSQEIKDRALISCMDALERSYGFLELPWFIWRAFNAMIGRDIKGQNNWSQDGIICSELCVTYLSACGLSNLFAAFGDGSVNAEDLRQIMEANPNLFTPIQLKE